MTGDRHNLIERREIISAYAVVLDRPGELIEICSAVDGDADELRRAVQEAFAVSSIAAEAILALQVRRFTPSERQKVRDELADLDTRLEMLGGS